MEGHHSDPKFLGGDPRQPKTQIPRGGHRQLHKDLNDHLHEQADNAGNHMRPQRGNSGAQIRENFSLDQRRQALADFYRQNRGRYEEAADDFFRQHPDLK
jgi:hypothetical protein